MLTFDTPFYEVEGVVIFRDHADPGMFHYLAGPPRLTKDSSGRPQFALIKYQHVISSVVSDPTTRDQLGGGFLTFSVNCGIDESRKTTIRNRLREFVPGDGEVKLAPVLYTKGKVKVVALDHQSAAEAPAGDGAADTPASRFVRGVLGTATPSLLTDQNAIFSLSLSPDGVELLEAAYENDLSPIGVMYELEFAGLRPALNVKVHADQKKIYEEFKMGLHLGVRSGGTSSTTPATTPATPGTAGTRNNAALTKVGTWPTGNDLTFTPSTSGDAETLTFVGPTLPTSVTVEGTAVTLDAQRRFPVTVPAGTTQHIRITLPAAAATTAVTQQTFLLFFSHDHPDDAEVASYSAGTPNPADARFTSASTVQGASPQGTVPDSLRTWLTSLAQPRRITAMVASSSFEATSDAAHPPGSANSHQAHNQALSQRRLNAAQALVNRLSTAGNLGVTISGTQAVGDGPARSASPRRDRDDNDRVVKITGGVGSSTPGQPVVLEATLTRAAAGTPTTPTPPTTPTTPASSPSGGGTQVALDADIDVSLKKLEQTGALTIEIIEQQQGEDIATMREAALQFVKETLLKDFFSPAMTTTPAAVTNAVTQGTNTTAASTAQTSRGATGSGTSVQVGFQLKYVKDEELKVMDYDYSVARPETRTHSPNGFFSLLVAGSDPSDFIVEAVLDSPFFQTLAVRTSTTARFDELHLDRILVHWRYGTGTAEPPAEATIPFSADEHTPRYFQAARRGDSFAYEHRAEYFFADTDEVAAQASHYDTGWQSSLGRELVVHPPDDVSMLRIYIEPGVIDWEVLERIGLRLSYDDPANGFSTTKTMLLSQETPRTPWIIRLSDPDLRSYHVQTTWYFKGGREQTGPVETLTEAHLYVPDPFVDRMAVEIRPQVDPQSVSSVLVEVLYEDAANELLVRKTMESRAPDFAPGTVLIPLMDPSRREYRYKVSLLRPTGGDPIVQPEVTTDRLTVFITEGDVIYFEVRLSLIGDLAAAGVSALQVDLRGEPPAGRERHVLSQLFEVGGDRSAIFRIALRSDRSPVFEYQVTAFMDSGEQYLHPWTEHERNILPLQVVRFGRPPEG